MDAAHGLVSGDVKITTSAWYGPLDDRGQPECLGDSPLRIPNRPRNDRLCSTCMSLSHLKITHWDSINNFQEVIINHHHSFNALLESVHEGCHFCGLLLIAWEENCNLYQKPNGEWVGSSKFDSTSLYGGIKLRFKRVVATDDFTGVKVDEVQIAILCGNLRPDRSARLHCAPGETNLHALPETCLPSMSDTNTGSSASMSRIKTWLDTCTSSHPACSQAASQPPPLPTRVIAVGQKGSSRCYLVSGKKRNGFYATLSHCWGDPTNQPLTTTDENLSSRQKGIEDGELPKTFRHAVAVCRAIGIEYLWIDSLCIIQGQKSQDDWAKEAPRMGLVYGNSKLTICAAAAVDSTKGCFKERLGLFFWPCPVVLFGKACYVSRYPTDNEEYGDPGDLAWGPMSRIILNQRAWVLQEQVLSRRSIIFSKNRLIWRCPTLSTNEKYPLGMLHSPNVASDNYRLFHCIINDITSLIQKELEVDIYTCWYRLISDFTSRKLTYDKDRLPAIAGLAERFRATSNDTYHAGLWRRDMIVGLLWCRMDSFTATKSANVPSWSWASINSGVDYRLLLSNGPKAIRIPLSPLVDILNVSDPSTCKDHPFGMTSKASLRLSGVLFDLVRQKNETYRLELAEGGICSTNDDIKILRDTWDFDMPAQIPFVCLPLCVRHDTYSEDAPGDSELHKASWKRFLDTGVQNSGELNRLFCLVLKVIEGKQDAYRRVGICVIDGHKITEVGRMAFGERRSLTIV